MQEGKEDHLAIGVTGLKDQSFRWDERVASGILLSHISQV